jgi:hypothetical protein
MVSVHILLKIHTVLANMHDFHNESPEAMARQRKTHESIQNFCHVWQSFDGRAVPEVV